MVPQKTAPNFSRSFLPIFLLKLNNLRIAQKEGSFRETHTGQNIQEWTKWNCERQPFISLLILREFTRIY